MKRDMLNDFGTWADPDEPLREYLGIQAELQVGIDIHAHLHITPAFNEVDPKLVWINLG